MATVASLSIFPSLGHHPVGEFSMTRNNPLVTANPTAVPAAFVTGTPAIKIPAPATAAGPDAPTQTEHFALCQFTSMVDVVLTGPGGDPNATGLNFQRVVWSSGVVAYSVVMPPGYNEIHIRPAT